MYGGLVNRCSSRITKTDHMHEVVCTEFLLAGYEWEKERIFRRDEKIEPIEVKQHTRIGLSAFERWLFGFFQRRKLVLNPARNVKVSTK